MSSLSDRVMSCDEAETSGPLPNFLYIGTSKAGSTWLFKVLSAHPQIFIAPNKGAYFFDHHFENGLAWYRRFFRGARGKKCLGEISHGYLFSDIARQRIAKLLPDVKLLVCLREPAERAMSHYLDLVKNGRWKGSVDEALTAHPEIIERSRYAHYLKPYFETFGAQQIHVALFDQLESDPAAFAQQMFAFLDVSPMPLEPALTQKIMPAARPRSTVVVQVSKRLARFAERVGIGGLRGRLKKSPTIRRLLYRPYGSTDKPVLPEETRLRLRALFRPEVQQLDSLLGMPLSARWKYADEESLKQPATAPGDQESEHWSPGDEPENGGIK